MSNTALAAPSFSRRQDISSDNSTATTASGPTQTLAPVVPPNVDTGSLQVLNPSKNVTLFFQTTPSSRKRDGSAVAAQVALGFKYPVVPLDHSDFVGSVSCTDKSVLATFADVDSYSHARSTWPVQSKFMLITSTQGCGPDDQNGYFVATSAAFTNGSLSVLAQGGFTGLNSTLNTANIVWGGGSTVDADGRRLRARDCDDNWCDSESISFNLSPEIAAEEANGEDESDAEANASQEDDDDAPWDNAYLLWEYNADDGESGATDKRALTNLVKREEASVEKSLKLYCVDCGIHGEFTLGGEVDYSVWELDVSLAQIYLNGNLHAGLYLGLEASVEYDNKITKELSKPNLLGWEIPLIINIGPYIELDLQAEFDAKAEGTLLVGGALDWPGFSATLDLLNPESSFQSGFEPQLTEKFEANGEISVSVSLGLPLAIGVGIDVLDGLWTADLELKDVPSINAEASISLSYINDNTYNTVDGTTIADDNNGLDLNDGCYGVAWQLTFENLLEIEAEADPSDPWDYTLYDWSYPLAQGCFGYTQPACSEPVRASPIVGQGVNCNMPLDTIVTGYEEGDSNVVDSRTVCAQSCMTDANCASFAWTDSTSTCQLYNTGFANLTANSGSTNAVFDRSCFQTKDCPFNATDSSDSSSNSKRSIQSNHRRASLPRMAGMTSAK
ncbi:hypothetical protein NA57DRAFT_81276 [Rhizodiscina lignyota]|uniref:Apple domain-containing protein n=1 Tax=Rhizodiscina lignyota TaxID=1504668 RepID=A0A9P4I7U3_9PEZI|nr:hypothetical protein NA57DRAFT_81276 [Rhizodiscina lignyota]